MRVPLSWLADYVEIELTPDELAERLTLLGMEVKAIERWGSDWQNVVVGELLTVERHPRADRLSLTTVALGDGSAPLEIVCGATNIAPGQRVPVALPGAVLPGGRQIERTEKMGVVSNGMLCSGDELNLTTDADGILILPADAPLGTSLTELYGDTVLDVDVKPNRGDALSLVGLAREVAAVTGGSIRWPDTEPAEDAGTAIDGLLAVEVRDPELCPRFVGRWLGGVTVGPSPDRVQMRLQAAGMRPVSNVVDASNYVMLELGKPIHAFDAAAVAEGDGVRRLVVRPAAPGERLETLDHVARELDPETLLIADERGPLAIAGVMGGAASEVGERTVDVIVESAIFDPISIRRTGKRYSLRSEASLRFEKGQETRLARLGADRCARLIAEWSGGTVAAGAIDTAPDEPRPARVAFRPARVNRLLGTSLPAAEQTALLARVGVGTEPTAGRPEVLIATEPQVLRVPGDDETLVAVVPTWRRDIAIEADVAEEVARIRGYDRIPTITPHTPMPTYRHQPLERRDLVRDTLVGAGLTEAVTSALVSPRLAETFRWETALTAVADGTPEGGRLVKVTNPLSQDHSVLRQTVLGSLVEVVSSNLRHGRPDVAIFEIAKGYGAEDDSTREWWRLAIAATGAARPAAWNEPSRSIDLDDVKGAIELLCRRLHLDPPAYAPVGGERLLHPGRAALVTAARGDGADGAIGLAGLVGELHPAIAEAWELRGARVVVAEVDLSGLAAGGAPVTIGAAPARQPAVERDLAVVVAEATPAGSVIASIRRHAGPLLRDLVLFDIYRGAPLAAETKSLAVRLAFQPPEGSTGEPAIEAAITAITAGLLTDVDGRIRT